MRSWDGRKIAREPQKSPSGTPTPAGEGHPWQCPPASSSTAPPAQSSRLGSTARHIAAQVAQSPHPQALDTRAAIAPFAFQAPPPPLPPLPRGADEAAWAAAVSPTLLPYSGVDVRRAPHGRDRAAAQQHADRDAWDAVDFKLRLANARAARSNEQVKAVLKEVATSNYRLVQTRFRKDVSPTVLVTRLEAQQRVQGNRQEAEFSVSCATTGDALMYFAGVFARNSSTLRQDPSMVCGLNFANGERVGGGYLNGASAQEEELCRQIPALYSSLSRSLCYPFGPCTYRGGPDMQRYADVLFTPCLAVRRGSQASGYRLLGEHETPTNISLVSAAAPDLKSGKDTFNQQFVIETMRSILVAPKLKDRRINTIVLGAWGCGAFANDPRCIASLFAEVLVSMNLGRLYQHVHFAIPSEGILRVFEEAFQGLGVPLRHVSV